VIRANERLLFHISSLVQSFSFAARNINQKARLENVTF
jgi:hypothetical protein